MSQCSIQNRIKPAKKEEDAQNGEIVFIKTEKGMKAIRRREL